MALETRSYGHAGDKLTVIGLGGTSLSKHSLDDGVATVHRALELGVTYFDTSPRYTGGPSISTISCSTSCSTASFSGRLLLYLFLGAGAKESGCQQQRCQARESQTFRCTHLRIPPYLNPLPDSLNSVSPTNQCDGSGPKTRLTVELVPQSRRTH